MQAKQGKKGIEMKVKSILLVIMTNLFGLFISVAVPVVLLGLMLLSASWYTGVGFEHGLRPVVMAVGDTLRPWLYAIWYGS